LRGNKQPWRGEVRLVGDAVGDRPLLVRADPVLSTPDRVLGFVLLFTDLADRKAAEAARTQFQDEILHSHRRFSSRMDSESNVKFQTLMSSVVENAQLAVLEITDSVDLVGVPAMLDSVRNSVARTAEVLDQLSLDADDGARTTRDRDTP